MGGGTALAEEGPDAPDEYPAEIISDKKEVIHEKISEKFVEDKEGMGEKKDEPGPDKPTEPSPEEKEKVVDERTGPDGGEGAEKTLSPQSRGKAEAAARRFVARLRGQMR